MLDFAQITSLLKRNKMADVKEILSVCGEFLRFYVNFNYIFNGIIEKCKNNDHTCVLAHLSRRLKVSL